MVSWTTSKILPKHLCLIAYDNLLRVHSHIQNRPVTWAWAALVLNYYFPYSDPKIPLLKNGSPLSRVLSMKSHASKVDLILSYPFISYWALQVPYSGTRKRPMWENVCVCDSIKLKTVRLFNPLNNFCTFHILDVDPLYHMYIYQRAQKSLLSDHKKVYAYHFGEVFQVLPSEFNGD